jgi:hypothetical protein
MKPMRKRRPHTVSSKNKRKSAKAMETALQHFIDYHPAKRLSTNLRTMLIDFLTSEGGTEALYLQDLLYDIGGLFELLDVIDSREITTE